ncbi:aspartate aminotransferase family protein [Desulfosporosinus lacus]|uniref:Adenosylmethionine-8-amino-7-oxononanoate aminotransferase n=1 Tax=Desulfosporosinus lacus DSM 15449 TaxID=1121420 RepID=A0A1M6ET41_9FIRM|nr:aspartate aminotransferase family protein [Desulfosporosinus lacus]SHI88529.1 Aminotransferase class-III [Desulfosporosinus lacus DSM 15449]
MNLVEKDLKYIWHPCSQMKDYEELKPIIIDYGKGVYLYDHEGKGYIDIISSWWCNLLGHCNPKINESIKLQLDKLEHVIFANFSHEPAITLCEQLIKIIPKGLSKFNFSDNGSATVECALKMSFQYQHQTGHEKKTKFMCLTEGYHGETVGALSVGSVGMRIYPAIYLKKLRVLCDMYNVILIADEIATGFGRTGKMFAFDHAGVSPDIMCISKGMTGGYMPMAITITTDKIYEAFYADYNEGKAFMHSHTYSGNPLGCSAALAVQKIFKEDQILEKAVVRAEYLHNALNEALLDHPHIGEIRHIGLVNAMELVIDKKTKEAYDSKLRIGYQIYKKALEKGLILRPLGNVLYFNPPLIINEEEIDRAVTICAESIKEVLGDDLCLRQRSHTSAFY